MVYPLDEAFWAPVLYGIWLPDDCVTHMKLEVAI